MGTLGWFGLGGRWTRGAIVGRAGKGPVRKQPWTSPAAQSRSCRLAGIVRARGEIMDGIRDAALGTAAQ